jgi:hypothetical protein
MRLAVIGLYTLLPPLVGADTLVSTLVTDSFQYGSSFREIGWAQTGTYTDITIAAKIDSGIRNRDLIDCRPKTDRPRREHEAEASAS